MGIETAILGSAAIGAGAQIFGSSKAAKSQEAMARQAMDFQMQMADRQRNDLMPYMNAGQGALGQLQQNMGYYTSPIQMLDQQGLEQLPGYAFTRDQGLKALQASAAAKGLGNSGTAIKGAERFATGLADQTYAGQFDRYFKLEQSNRQDPFNRLMQMVNTGQNAAAGVGNTGMQAAQMIGNNLTGIGNAQGAAAMAQGNAIAGGANSIMNYAMMNQMMNPAAAAARNTGMYGPSVYMGDGSNPWMSGASWGAV